MEYKSKLNTEDIAKHFLWKNYVSQCDELSDYYVLIDEDGKPIDDKNCFSTLFPIMSSLHPSRYCRLTHGELYELNELYVDKCCATCKYWDRSKTNKEKPNKLPCLKKSKEFISTNGENCDFYERRYVCLGKRKLVSEYDRWLTENKNS